MRDVRDLSTEDRRALEGLGDASDLAVVVEEQASGGLAGESGAFAPGPALEEIGFRTGGDEGVPCGAVGVVGAAEDGRHRSKGSGFGGVDNQAMAKPSKPAPDVAHYDDGGIRYRGFQLDGEMHGEWEFLRKDGSVMRKGEFDRGKQVGVWRTFNRAGMVVKETDFSRRG